MLFSFYLRVSIRQKVACHCACWKKMRVRLCIRRFSSFKGSRTAYRIKHDCPYKSRSVRVKSKPSAIFIQVGGRRGPFLCLFRPGSSDGSHRSLYWLGNSNRKSGTRPGRPGSGMNRPSFSFQNACVPPARKRGSRWQDYSTRCSL